MRVLVTAFEPFGEDAENASEVAVRLLAQGWRDPAVELLTAVLPVTFAGAPARLAELVRGASPDALLCVGEAGSRVAITPERWGRNWIDARIPDNAGRRPRGVRADAGPSGRAPGLDVSDMVRRMRAAGLPAEASEDAGAFVCNLVAYTAPGLGVPAAFVHVPAVRSAGTATVGGETDGAPAARSGLGFDDLARALALCVTSAARTARRGYSSPR